ncbi:hypothetical protein DsansV1_C44g0240481 [Dioscorea sansibarensis]
MIAVHPIQAFSAFALSERNLTMIDSRLDVVSYPPNRISTSKLCLSSIDRSLRASKMSRKSILPSMTLCTPFSRRSISELIIAFT